VIRAWARCFCGSAPPERINFSSRGGHVDENIRTNTEILTRLERLERENRRLRRGALIGVALVASLIASLGLLGQAQQTQTTQQKAPAPRAKKPAAPAAAPAPAPPPPAPFVMPKNIEAESFILKDANGRVRAELAMSGEGPSLKLRDQSGTALVTLSLLDSAPGGPLLLLSDAQHRASLSMSVVSGQGSQLSLIGERADIQAHIGVAPDGTTLELTDKDGFTTSIGNGVKAAKNGQVKNTTAGSITLFGKDRKVLWSAP